MKIKSTIYRRKAKPDRRAGKWYLRMRWTDTYTGEPRGFDRQFDRKADAIDERDRQKRQIEASEGRVAAGDVVTFGDLVELARREIYHSATYEEGLKTGGVKALSTVDSALKHLLRYFGNKPITSIDGADLREYRIWRQKIGSQNPALVKQGIKRPVSPGTINRELGVARRLFRLALDREIISRDIFRTAGAIHKRLERPRERILTHEELDRLIAACDTSMLKTFKRRRCDSWAPKGDGYDRFIREIAANSPYIKSAILLAADSGLRKGEILKLRRSDVDLIRCRVLVRAENAKTERERVEGLTARTVEALQKMLALFSFSETDPFIFAADPSGSRPITTLTRAWKKVVEIAGVDDCRFHDLRRTAATVLVRDLGYGVDFAGKILGHAPASAITERHYLAVDDPAIDGMLEKLNELHRTRAERKPHQSIH